MIKLGLIFLCEGISFDSRYFFRYKILEVLFFMLSEVNECPEFGVQHSAQMENSQRILTGIHELSGWGLIVTMGCCGAFMKISKSMYEFS